MTLAAAIEAELPYLRAEAEANMTSTCLVTKDGAGDPTFNETTGQYTDPARVTVYEGKCRLQVTAIIAGSVDSDAGERLTTTQEAELQLPIGGTDDVAVDHQVKILTNPLDPALEDRVFSIVARHEKSQATSRRVRVVEVTG
jgi:hypothetical protein